MKCPYCSNEVKTGWLRSSSEIFWSEKKSNFSAYHWDDLLVSQSGITIDNISTDYCETCKKLFVNLDKESTTK